MTAKPEPRLVLETEWLRQYARTYLPQESGFQFSPETLRRANISLVDVRNLMRRGVVTYADKLDTPGAMWVVEGRTPDGEFLRLTIVVISENWEVRLLEVFRITSTLEGEAVEANR